MTIRHREKAKLDLVALISEKFSRLLYATHETRSLEPHVVRSLSTRLAEQIVCNKRFALNAAVFVR